jgi:hypothetical protein
MLLHTREDRKCELNRTLKMEVIFSSDLLKPTYRTTRPTCMYVCMYCGVYATDKMGSSSDDWLYYQVVTHSLLITLIHRLYNAVSHIHQLKSAVAHALGFSVHTSRFPATDVDAQL